MEISMEGRMATTLYIAVERLIDMQDASNWKLIEPVASSLATHKRDCRFVATFAPHRFGLIFESRDEVDEAWGYIRSWLGKRGYRFDEKCVLIKSDGDTTELRNKEGCWLANRADEAGWAPHLRIVNELPAARVPLSQRIKNLLAAALLQ